MEQEGSGSAGLSGAIVSSFFDAIISKTLAGTITSWNAAASALFGYCSEEVIGEPIRRLIPTDRQDEEDRVLARIKAGERVEPYMTVRLDKSGRPIDVFLIISPICDTNQHIIGASEIILRSAARKIALETLRESEERLRSFVEHAPAAILMLDRNLVHLASSRRWLEGVGLQGIEIIGRPHYEFFPNIPESWKEAHRRGLAGEVVSADEEIFGLPDGAMHYGRWEVRPWFMADQSIGGITIMFEDVTERVEARLALRESEERLKFALEAGEVGTWEISLETRVLAASDRAYTLIDIPAGTPLRYEMLLARVHPDDQARVDKAFRRTFETGQPFATEWRLLLPDGSVRWLETRAECRSLAGKQVVGGLVQDITVRINQKETAERAAKAESEFLSNMSHELRTPMHAILGYTEICTDAVKEGAIDGIEKCLNNVTSAGKRLLDLLNNLLELAKMEDGRVEYKFERADLKDVVEHTLMELDPLIKAKKQQINVSLGNHTDAHIDRTHLIQVLVNLVSNAIKFSAAGSQIGIELSDDRLGGGDQIRCSVTDEGPGIPDDELRAVFDKFVQSKKTKTGKGGTGLGLAISDHIIKAHGGKIWAENAKPHGAIFTFVIPRDHDPGGRGINVA